MRRSRKPNVSRASPSDADTIPTMDSSITSAFESATGEYRWQKRAVLSEPPFSSNGLRYRRVDTFEKECEERATRDFVRISERKFRGFADIVGVDQQAPVF